MAFAYGGAAYEDLWAATKSHEQSRLVDMTKRSCPLLQKINGNNNVKGKELKGKRFVEPILARVVENVQAIDMRGQLTTSEPSLLEVIEVEPKLLYQGVMVYDKLIAVNSANELVSLLEVYRQGVREGFMREFAKGIYKMGLTNENPTAPTDMNGLAYMISENPYAPDLVRYNLVRGLTGDDDNKLPGGKYEFWRNRAGEWVTDTTSKTSPVWPSDKDGRAKAVIDAMTMMLLVLNGVSEVAAAETMNPVIDGIYMNYQFYNLFQYARYQLLHINNVASEKIDVGFVKLEHMGIPVYLDKNCPMNKIYFVDSSQVELLYVEGENFKQEVKEIPTYFAKNYITSFFGNYIIHKARNCGVVTLNEKTNGLPVDCNVCNADKFYDYDYKNLAGTSAFPDAVENTGYSGSGVYVPTPKPFSTESKKTK
jgi:hypothetical protein